MTASAVKVSGDESLRRAVALITGASRGIGLAIAARIVAEGGRVCITARKAEALTEAAAGLGGADNAVAVAGNADDVEHQAAAVAATVSAFGQIDILVNNTGINPVYGPLLDLDPRPVSDHGGQRPRRAVVG